ncbi:sacsin N-terminal ATP-binding-like domain-containing protein [Prevotella veroralis]|uniref:Protein NO VEIN C-terminal domain-containing protein n=1 Tax=Prevotella veroralis F0319 TaxID=649761 RepID=C9MRX3_9BACT|nr:hypothetical protein [Prevotella veroralis]EEX17742.1 hypothetical protein HMPREF0973_02386 [Prevotella veroralis F0319]QUB41570.1 hypothetical protein J5A55_10380 [Prevotella veroralis]
MLDNKIKESLHNIFLSMPKESLPKKGDGWVNENQFAKAVLKERINFKDMGYTWFNEFLKDSGIFVFCKEQEIWYVNRKLESKRRNTQRKDILSANSKDAENIKRRLRLENNLFIGQFAPQKNEGWYTITDIRNTDFTKIEDKERGVKNLSIPFRSNKDFNRFAYYKFTWVLLEIEPLKFGIDLREEITPIWPKDIVSSLYDGIMRYPAGAAKKIARSLDTLKKQLTQSGKEVFIYELLQNANDYPRRAKINGEYQALPVDVEFHITKNYLTFQHTGEYFNPKNIAAICDINDGEKADNTKAIGYKGIGFKTVFLDNDYVLLNTGNYTFRFDKSATDVINTPWQILPIWTENNEIDNDIKFVFRQHPNDEFRVKFALQPRDKEILTDEDRDDNYIDLFTDVFESERIILFIPNIKKVSIFIDGQDEPIVREKDNKDWCVSDSLVDDIPEDITDKINDVLENPDSLRSDGYEKIPEKYMNFRKTAVKFACKKAERKLMPVDDAMLYCYLPAKRADWGFNFLMNTDMVPNGQRDDIEDIELNHVIARIAGKQFFYWIKQLIESKKYDLDSIFALIPDFDECKKRRVYKKFIEEFQEEFEKLIKEEPFVPCVDKDGEQTFECIDNIINDMTGMTANGVISDEDFIILMELGDYSLPVDELRQSEAFMDFLYKHSPSSLDVKVDAVVKKCEETDFQTWLTVPENNTRFIRHWLSEDELNEFAKKNIFIEYKGNLFTAGSLYYDFDTNCNRIGFLRRFVPHLCEASRANFEEDENWKSFADKYFLSFSAASMITDYILSNEDAMELLNVPSNSVAFYRYLAVKEVDLKANKTKVPYITEDGGASTDYTNYHYFFNEEAHGLTREKWLGENVINVLSHIYFDGLGDDKRDNLINIFTRLGFHDFVKESFITAVVVNDANFRAKVNAAIENNYVANKAFVDYIFNCETQLKENSFRDYVLRCVDIKGNEVYLCNDDVRYFNQEAFAQNSTYADNTHHAWLQENMMYALSNAYFEDYEKEEGKRLESFLRQQFGIKTFTDKSFFMDVVIKNKTAIYSNLVDETTMLTFLEYLKRDADRIFDGSMSFNDIRDMPLLAYDGTILRSRLRNKQYIEYDEDAKILFEKTWCPKTYVILSQKYTDDFSQDMRQLFKIMKFDFNTATNNLVTNTFLQYSVKVVANSIDFWRWVRANQKQITSVDKFKAIPLLDKNNALINSTLLYISDTYQQEQIESLVTKYVKEAKFVSSSYIETTNENEKAEWIKLFKKLGLKSDNKDILFSDILPNLATIETDSLDSVVAMMTKHLKDLKDKWAERKHQIIQLRVRTQSGEYKTLDQVTIVKVDEDAVSEPFKYITLANEVHPDILKSNKELLLAISAEFQNRNLITTKQKWIDAKVKDYLNQFGADENSVAAIHIQFVREVAKIQNEFDININLRKQIKYLVKSQEAIYKYAHELTLGSSYSPACDFEANGVSELSYLSDTYIFEDNKDIIKQYFKAENVHQNMTREDLKYLANRTFACYFWSKCFSRRLVEYESWVEDGCFNNRMCIPTENSVKTPELLYAPYIAGYAVRAKAPQWQEKVPCKAVVDSIDNREARELFEKINFCKALSFEDCLYYLARVAHPREDESHFRGIVINWMLSSPNQDARLVDNYRKTPTAEWRNGKGQKKHITKLYAIHPEATQERNIFRGDEFVMQTSAFPKDTDSFVKVCDMLKIKCLTSSDFKATPIGKEDQTMDMVAILRPRLLILSAIENPDKFQELYERYNTRLSQYHFVVCEKIDLGYDTIHNDVERIYNDDYHLYYVSSWKHRRTFAKFCRGLKRLVGLDVYDDVCEEVLDSVSVEECIEKYCSSLAYDEKFRAYLRSLDLTINVEPEEEEPIETENDYYSNATNEPTDSATEPTTETSTENQHVDDTETIREDDKPGAPNKDVTSRPVNELEVGEEAETLPKEPIQTASQQPTSDSRPQQQSQQTESPVGQTTSSTAEEEPKDDFGQYDTYKQVDEEDIEDYDDTDDVEADVDEDVDTTDNASTMSSNTHTSNTSRASSNMPHKDYDPDRNGYMGSVDKEKNYQPVGDRPYKPRTRKHPKIFTKKELERLRSHGTPLELESLPPTREEIDLLAQCNIKPEQIADTNYLAQLRLYQNLRNEMHAEPEETMEEFVRNASDVTVHKLKDGRYIHTCSAARGVMYASPSVWNKMVDDKWKICVYLDGQGKNFHYINNAEEFLKLVEKDDVVIKITGKEKVDVVKTLYGGLLEGAKGTVYTLIRVAARTNMDAVFAHYVGAMAEAEDGNDDYNDNDY